MLLDEEVTLEDHQEQAPIKNRTLKNLCLKGFEFVKCMETGFGSALES